MKYFHLLIPLFIFLLFQCRQPAAEIADILLTNGKVYTVNEDQPWAEAIAIRDNEIVFVGSSKDATRFIGESTQQTDLKGKMVLPGFVSGHDHLIASNWTKSGVNLFSAGSKAEYLQLIKEYADANPDLEFIIGYGWETIKYGGIPTAKDLDAVVPNRPAMLFDYTIHDMWFNTKGLEAAGVTRETPDPQPGFSYWRRDADGEIEGVAIEVAWLNAFMNAGAWKPEIMIRESQQFLYQKAAESGLTAVINQGLVTPNIKNNEDYIADIKASFEMLYALDKEGKLQLRTFQQSFYKNANIPVEDIINASQELKQQYNSDRLSVSGIKIHAEGNWNTKTSLMLEPYADGSGEYGNAGVPSERIEEMILKANAAGFDVSVHVDGTATVRATIDAIEKSRDAGHTGMRNSLQHYHWVTPEDHQRTLDMEIPVNVTPIFSTDWSDTEKLANKFLGIERAKQQYALYPELFANGLKVSLSADIPSSPVDLIGPLYNMEVAMTLQDPDNEASIPYPPGRKGISLEDAIKGVTIYPAWQARMEDKIGSIEVGKYADLVILEENLFDVAARDIADVKVIATMMDGKYTFRAD